MMQLNNCLTDCLALGCTIYAMGVIAIPIIAFPYGFISKLNTYQNLLSFETIDNSIINGMYYSCKFFSYALLSPLIIPAVPFLLRRLRISID